MEKFFNYIAHFLTGHALCFVHRTGWDRRSWDRANFLKLISLFHHFDVINLEQVETFGRSYQHYLSSCQSGGPSVLDSIAGNNSIAGYKYRFRGLGIRYMGKVYSSFQFDRKIRLKNLNVFFLLQDYHSSQYPQSDAKSYTILVESEPYSNFMTAHISKAILPLLLENDELYQRS